MTWLDSLLGQYPWWRAIRGGHWELFSHCVTGGVLYVRLNGCSVDFNGPLPPAFLRFEGCLTERIEEEAA